MKSAEGLLQSLLVAIALCGLNGATTAEILGFVHSYFQEHGPDQDDDADDIGLPAQRPLIDRPYFELVWSWLSRLAELSIGPEGQANAWTLSEIEAHNERVVSSVTESGAPSTSKSATSGPSIIKVNVSEEQVWSTLAGHGIDHQKIKPHEFLLLTAIASHGPRGVMQPDLVAFTGQDKRSVPIRTGRLYDGGYIIKIGVIDRGTRTSWLIHQRYAHEIESQIEQQGIHFETKKIRKRLNHSELPAQQLALQDDARVKRSIIRDAFEVLCDRPFIDWHIFKAELNINYNSAVSCFLASAFQKFHRVGCIERSIACDPGSESGSNTQIHHLRQPTRKETDAVLDTTRLGIAADAPPLNDSSIISQGLEEQELPDESSIPLAGGKIGSQVQASSPIDLSQSVSQALPWNPDGMLVHTIRQIIEEHGASGMTNSELVGRVAGRLYKRPMEAVLTRLGNFWQISQPPHLRHLGLVKDTQQVDRTSVFVHYTRDQFQTLVDQGEKDWDVVKVLSNIKESQAEVDGYGFPVLADDLFQGAGNDATMAEALTSARGSTRRTKPRKLDPQKGKKLITEALRSKASNKSDKRPKEIPSTPKLSLGDKQPPNTVRTTQGMAKKDRNLSKSKHAKESVESHFAKEQTPSHGLRRVSQSKEKLVNSSRTRKLMPSEKDVVGAIGYFPSTLTHFILHKRLAPPGESVRHQGRPKKIEAVAQYQRQLLGFDGIAFYRPSSFLPKILEGGRRRKKTQALAPQGERLTQSSGNARTFPSTQSLKQTSDPSNLPPVNKGAKPLVLAGGREEVSPRSGARSRKQTAKALESAQETTTPSLKRKQLPVTKATDLAKRRKFEEQYTYQEQAAALPRSGPGFYIRQPTPLKKDRPRGRPPLSRLAIIKTTRLAELQIPTDIQMDKFAVAPIMGPNITPQSSESTAERNVVTTNEVSIQPSIEHLSLTDQLSRSAWPDDYNSGTGNPLAAHNDVMDNGRIQPAQPHHSTSVDIGTADAGSSNGSEAECRAAMPAIVFERGQTADQEAPADASDDHPIIDSQLRQAECGAEHLTGQTPNKAIALGATVDQSTAVPEAQREASPSQAGNSPYNVTEESSWPYPIDEVDPHGGDQAKTHRESERTAHEMKEGYEDSSLYDQSILNRGLCDEVTIFPRTNPSHKRRLSLEPEYSSGYLPLKRQRLSHDATPPLVESHVISNPSEQDAEQAVAASANSPAWHSSTIEVVAPDIQEQQGTNRNRDTTSSEAVGFSNSHNEANASTTSVTPTESRATNAVIKMTAGGGSVAAERRKVALSIIQKAGGICPGDRELWYPFATAWMKTHNGIKPDRRTIRTIKDTMVQNKQLVQFTFTHRAKAGHAVTRNIVALAGTDLEDPLVKQQVQELQEKMIACDPKLYIPESFEISTEIKAASTDIAGESNETNPNTGGETTTKAPSRKRKAPAANKRDKTVHKKRKASAVKPVTGSPPSPSAGFAGHGTLPYPDIWAQADEFGLLPLPPSIIVHKSAIAAVESNMHQNPQSHAWPTSASLHSTTPENDSPSHEYGFQLPTQHPTDFQRVSPEPRPTLFIQQEVDGQFLPDSNVDPEITGIYQRPGEHANNITFQEIQPDEETPAHVPHMAQEQDPPLAECLNIPAAMADAVQPEASSLTKGPLTKEGPSENGKSRQRRSAAIVKPRRLVALTEKVEKRKENPRPAAAGSQPKAIRIRAKRNSLTGETAKRIFFAVLISRTILGGLHKEIDWDVAEAMLEPEFNKESLRTVWTRVREKYKDVSKKLHEEFSDIFIQGYASGTIPTLNMEERSNYDWKWLLQWTIGNIDTSSHTTMQLPQSREELDQQWELHDASRREQVDYFEVTGKSTIPKRHATLHQHPWGIPVDNSRRDSEQHDSAAIAYNWTRANIIVPESSYDPLRARDKLLSLGDVNVHKALQKLISNKVLTEDHKGRLMAARTYDIAEAYTNRFKSNLNLICFREAAAYKALLDEKFSCGEPVCLHDAITDGETMALMNLVAQGYIKLVQHNVPMKKWGLVGQHGYQTRKMDRKQFSFGVELAPSDSYVYGNPLLPYPEPPRCKPRKGIRGKTITKFPLWYDLNDDLAGVLWDLARVSVLSQLAIKPGLTISRLEKALKNALEPFELELLLQWIVEAGAGEWVGTIDRSVRLKDWWWLGLGQIDRKGKGKATE